MTRAPVEMDSTAAVLADKVEQDAADGGIACAGCQKDDRFAAVFLQVKRTERAFDANNAFFFDFGFAAENHFRADTVFAPADVQFQNAFLVGQIGDGVAAADVARQQ